MDPDLVTRAQQGDRRAFEAIAADALPRLYRVALGVLGDPTVAEDATQRALLAIWRYMPRLRDPSRFDGWSYRLLVRACYAEAHERPAWTSTWAVDESSIPAASDEIIGVVRRDELERGFRRLSVDQRTVLVLRYLLDWPLERIAEVLDVPVGTVGSRLNRALAALRAALEADARPAGHLAVAGRRP
jgi:RNA polymerase sigma-70 factor (ECF subfamily)